MRVYGEVEHLHASRGGGRARSPAVSLKLDASPQWLTWNCWALGCRAYADIFKLRDAPWPMAEAYRIGDHLVGLTINGHTYLHPAQERERLIRSDVGTVALMATLSLAMALIAGRWLVQRARHYRAPGPSGAQRMKRLMPGRNLTKTGSRP